MLAQQVVECSSGCRRAQETATAFALTTSKARALARPAAVGNVLRLGTLANTLHIYEELPFATEHADHCSVRWLRTDRCGAGTAENTSPEQPHVNGEPPTVGGGSSKPLSDKLAQSKGGICPPAGIDRTCSSGRRRRSSQGYSSPGPPSPRFVRLKY